MPDRSDARSGTGAPAGASVDLVLLALADAQLQVLLRDTPAGRAALPWARLRGGLSLEPAAKQLSRDTIRAVPGWLAQSGAFSDGDHPGHTVVTIGYVGVTQWRETPGGLEWHAAPRAARLLGARQRQVLEAALAVARARSESAPVAFRLLPRDFTLAELQQAYETLLGRRLHKASFRRALHGAWLVEPQDAWRSEGRGRPAQLFRFVPRRRVARRGVRFEVV